MPVQYIDGSAGGVCQPALPHDGDPPPAGHGDFPGRGRRRASGGGGRLRDGGHRRHDLWVPVYAAGDALDDKKKGFELWEAADSEFDDEFDDELDQIDEDVVADASPGGRDDADEKPVVR